MINPSHLNDSLTVLRDITLNARPHVLARPAAKPAMAAVAAVATAAPAAGTAHAANAAAGPAAGAAHQAAAAQPAPATPRALSAEEEVRLHERYKQGHAKGWLEGQLAERKAAESKAQTAGYEQGLQRGLEEARKTARAEVEQRLATLDQLLRSIPGQMAALLADAEDDMVALCFEAVCQISGATAASPDGVRQLVRQAAGRLRAQRVLVLQLHPQDVAMLKADPSASAWLQDDAWPDGVQLVADPQVQLGGAIVRGQQGSVDARLETQLGLLKDLLLQQRRAFAQAAAVAAANKTEQNA